MDFKQNFFTYLFQTLDINSNCTAFIEMTKIGMCSKLICSNCGVVQATSSFSYCLDCEPVKSIGNAINYITESVRLKDICKNCSSQLLSENEIVSVSRMLIIHIKRFREVPYPYKFSEKFKFSKKLNIANKDYTLIAVITHEGNIEQGKYKCVCKRGKAWYICTNTGLVKILLSEVLEQIPCMLIYYIYEI